MQNSGTVSVNGSCIAPPPPPLPHKYSSNQKCKCLSPGSQETKSPKKSSPSNIISALRHITHNFYIENPANLVSFYNPVSPVIQDGRCCGIVALSMASQLFCDTSVADILSVARSLNFTKEGEMFSAYNMATLATNLLNCHAVVLDDLYMHKVDILNHICDGHPLLIPYDADKNHFPCVNHGLTAHWAVVTGLCFAISDKSHSDTLSTCKIIKDFPELNIFVTKDSLLVKDLLECSEKIFLYAHQGKSRHLAAWDLNDLLESNSSMYEVTKKYSSNELVLPVNDFLSELRNKAVLLKKIQQC